MKNLHDQFAIEAGESGNVITTFTVSDFPFTIDEENNLTGEDRAEVAKLFVLGLSSWDECAEVAVDIWRNGKGRDADETD